MIKARIFNVRNYLKEKVGSGGFSPFGVKRAQESMEDCARNPQMFVELSSKILENMQDVIKSYDDEDESYIKKMRPPALDLKANGEMFGYASVTLICADVLDVLQQSDEVNKDLLDLYRQLYQTVKYLLEAQKNSTADKLVGDFGREISSACERYRKKYGLKSRFSKK